jgi:hypothetical protein
MSPEFLEALELVKQFDQTRPKQTVEYRLYYNQDGEVTMYCEVDHPDTGNYIVIDHPDIFFKNNSSLMRVINGKLIILSSHMPVCGRLTKSNSGQRVVKGMAAIALTADEQYQHVEHYDRKTIN